MVAFTSTAARAQAAKSLPPAGRYVCNARGCFIKPPEHPAVPFTPCNSLASMDTTTHATAPDMPLPHVPKACRVARTDLTASSVASAVVKSAAASSSSSSSSSSRSITAILAEAAAIESSLNSSTESSSSVALDQHCVAGWSRWSVWL